MVISLCFNTLDAFNMNVMHNNMFFFPFTCFLLDPKGHKEEARRIIKKNELGVRQIIERDVHFAKENDKIIFCRYPCPKLTICLQNSLYFTQIRHLERC